MRRWVRLATLTPLLLFASVSAYACPLCLGGAVFIPGERLDLADRAVIAVPEAGSHSFWRRASRRP